MFFVGGFCCCRCCCFVFGRRGSVKIEVKHHDKLLHLFPKTSDEKKHQFENQPLHVESGKPKVNQWREIKLITCLSRSFAIIWYLIDTFSVELFACTADVKPPLDVSRLAFEV